MDHRPLDAGRVPPRVPGPFLLAVHRQAVQFAEDAADPDRSELCTDVYANPQPNLSPTAKNHHAEKNPLL